MHPFKIKVQVQTTASSYLSCSKLYQEYKLRLENGGPGVPDRLHSEPQVSNHGHDVIPTYLSKPLLLKGLTNLMRRVVGFFFFCRTGCSFLSDIKQARGLFGTLLNLFLHHLFLLLLTRPREDPSIKVPETKSVS